MFLLQNPCALGWLSRVFCEAGCRNRHAECAPMWSRRVSFRAAPPAGRGWQSWRIFVCVRQGVSSEPPRWL